MEPLKNQDAHPGTCKHGHAYTPDNLRYKKVSKKGRKDNTYTYMERVCLACNRANNRRYHYRKIIKEAAEREIQRNAKRAAIRNSSDGRPSTQA